MRIRVIYHLVVIAIVALVLQGCGIGILAAGVGHAIGQGRKGTAAIIEARSKFTSQYNTYKLGMEEINIKRETSGLKPKDIMDFGEWLDFQPLSPEEVKLFSKYEATTKKDMQ